MNLLLWDISASERSQGLLGALSEGTGVHLLSEELRERKRRGRRKERKKYEGLRRQGARRC